MMRKLALAFHKNLGLRQKIQVVESSSYTCSKSSKDSDSEENGRPDFLVKLTRDPCSTTKRFRAQRDQTVSMPLTILFN
jgi:hypothetical protein